jgi:hypothetical protein
MIQEDPARLAHASDPLARFLSHVRPEPNGCLVWTGCTRDGDYGAFKVNGHVVLAHRWYYEHVAGPIGQDPETGESLTLDHLDGCAGTMCVNPGCLEQVTRAENSRRQAERRRAKRMAA